MKLFLVGGMGLETGRGKTGGEVEEERWEKNSGGGRDERKLKTQSPVLLLLSSPRSPTYR
jgi:hypothetical protein